MLKKLPRLNMTMKLVLFLLWVSVLPLLVLGIISYNTSRSVIQEDVSNYTLSIMIDQKDYLELLLESVESLIANVSGVEDIKNVLDDEYASNDTYTRLATHAQIGYILNGHLNLKGLVSIDIFTLTGAHYHVGDTLNVQEIDRELLDQLYREAENSDELVLWTGVENNVNINSTHKKVVTAAKLFTVIDAEQLQERPIALLLVNYSTDSLYNHFNQLNLGQGAYMMIVDAKDRLIFHPNKQLIGSQVSPVFLEQLIDDRGSFVTDIDNQEMLVTYSRSDISDWVLVSLVPVANLTTSVDTIQNTTLLVLVISFLFISLAAVFVSKTTVTPIKRITELFKQIEAGTFDGKTRFTEKRTDEVGELLQWFNTFLDSLEAKRQADLALIYAKEAAEQANRAKSAFLATMSHELRTPLNGVLGYTQILQRDASLDQRQKEAVKTIQQSGDHLLTLIDDILDLAKIETGKMDLHKTAFNLPQFLKDVGNIVRVRAERKGITFLFETAPSTNGQLPVFVQGDEKRLRQVLINLLGNAIKFTDTGTVTLRVSVNGEFKTQNDEFDTATHSSLCNLHFEVEDTGIGIPADQLEIAFDSFQQLGDYKHKVKGTGLGLPICRNLVELMDGTLHVKSEVDQGSLFWFDIPLLKVVYSESSISTETYQIIGVKASRPPKILVVDDRRENRAVLIDLLLPLGFVLEEAADGYEGLPRAVAFQPDAILIDLIMPKMNGLEMIRQVRQTPSLENVVIIANSASAYPEDAKKSLAAGSNIFISKPVQANVLLDALHDFLNLEWIYEIDDLPDKEPVEIVPPPPDRLDLLIQLAAVGDIGSLRKQVAELETDEKLKPFATELGQLIKTFQVDQIRAMLKSYQT